VEHRIESGETNVKSYDAARRQICDITCEPKVSDRQNVPPKEIAESEILH
jgi:hypothetical protein